MKIIIRNRNKNIEVSNITSKEEMVWITPEQYSQITTDAGTMATEFMQKHPQIHEVKFSVIPQIDDEEDEEQFYASEEQVNENGDEEHADENGDENDSDGQPASHCGQDADREQAEGQPKA